MKTLLFILLLTLSTSFVAAQNTNANVYLKQVTMEAPGESNLQAKKEFYSVFSHLPLLSNIQRLIMDSNQIAKVDVEGENNFIELSQSGIANIGIMSVQGSYNDATLFQDGYGLLSILNINGNQNLLDVEQTGTNLQNYIEVTGTGLAFDIQQTERGVTMSQSGPNAIPLEIKKTGRSIPIIIKNN